MAFMDMVMDPEPDAVLLALELAPPAVMATALAPPTVLTVWHCDEAPGWCAGGVEASPCE